MAWHQVLVISIIINGIALGGVEALDILGHFASHRIASHRIGFSQHFHPDRVQNNHGQQHILSFLFHFYHLFALGGVFLLGYTRDSNRH